MKSALTIISEVWQDNNLQLALTLNPSLDLVKQAMEEYAEQLKPKWQPIETAPKGYDHPYTNYRNGQINRAAKFILLGNSHHAGVGWLMIREDHEEDGDLLMCVDECGEWIVPTPTHWMPLPEPPTPIN